MLPWIICAGLCVIIAVLVIKILVMQKSMREISECLAKHLSSDSNQLITVSSGDRYVRRLAANISHQLALLRRQRRKYITGDRELKEAVTNISHDLRTPLTAICGYLDLLDREDKSADAERYLLQIKDRAEALKALTEDLFRYSIILASDAREDSSPTEINRILEESIASFYAVLNDRGIKPNISMTKEKIVRNLNASALSRVFSNLLNNAVKYSDGDLDISLSESGEILFSNTASELDEVEVGKLFDRFYTVDNAHRSTGLGLSIAKTLVIQMNGTINAKYENRRLSIIISFP